MLGPSYVEALLRGVERQTDCPSFSRRRRVQMCLSRGCPEEHNQWDVGRCRGELLQVLTHVVLEARQSTIGHLPAGGPGRPGWAFRLSPKPGNQELWCPRAEDGPLCSIQIGWCPPQWRGCPSSLSPPIQMLLSSRNTLTATPRENVSPTVWVSIGPVKLTH